MAEIKDVHWDKCDVLFLFFCLCLCNTVFFSWGFSFFSVCNILVVCFL